MGDSGLHERESGEVVSEVEQWAVQLRSEMLGVFPGLGMDETSKGEKRAKSLEVKRVQLLVDTPRSWGKKTPIGVGKSADKGQIEAQLLEYLAFGFLKEVGLRRDCFLSPLLPL